MFILQICAYICTKILSHPRAWLCKDSYGFSEQNLRRVIQTAVASLQKKSPSDGFRSFFTCAMHQRATSKLSREKSS